MVIVGAMISDMGKNIVTYIEDDKHNLINRNAYGHEKTVSHIILLSCIAEFYNLDSEIKALKKGIWLFYIKLNYFIIYQRMIKNK